MREQGNGGVLWSVEGPGLGCDFGTKEESMLRDVFIFNMRNVQFREQLYVDALSAVDALHLALARKRERERERERKRERERRNDV